MTWPAVVWEAPLLRDLDLRGRAELEAAGALRTRARGEVIFAQDESAESVFVVVEGAVELSTARGNAAVRRALRGDSFGEEALVRAGVRRSARALACEAALVAQLPAALLLRTIERCGAGARLAPIERALLRAAARALLESTFAGLDADAIERLTDAADVVRLTDGARLFAEGDRRAEILLVGDGLLRLERGSDTTEGATALIAYAARGDLLNEDGVCNSTARACGAAWVLAFDASRARAIAGAAVARAIAARDGRRAAHRRIAARDPSHPLADLPRLRSARSLLIVDQAACVRCGACESACADAHADGIVRLARRGAVAKVANEAGLASVLFAEACHHCDDAACASACPTAAIAPDARGAITIDEQRCIGCSACVRACAWGNVRVEQQAGRPVAVKCDLCSAAASGPACVRACPTAAMARVVPAETWTEAGAKVPAIARRVGDGPWLAAVAVGVAAMARPIAALAASHRYASGAAAAALLIGLLAYAVVKRMRAVRVAVHARAHAALGLAAAGAVAVHARALFPPGSGGAAQLAFALAMLSGVVCAALYAAVPRALARIEREVGSIDELRARRDDIDAQVFVALSGKDAATKQLFERVIRPDARSAFGALALAIAPRSREQRTRSIDARIRALIGEPSPPRARDLAALVRFAVDRRALTVQIALTRVLRVPLPLHAVTAAVAVVAIALHVAMVMARR